ncbi:hypothetical protein [Kribbella deserti]|uniref:Uncharacterized protein n=1 Tax=Kribbella deserti TaxID=1926257 RepID=A0ABV6QR72_9ACTN
MGKRVRIAAAAMAAIGLLFVAWIYLPRHLGGPLGNGAGDLLCLPADREPDAALGMLVLENTGDADVTLTGIYPVDAENLSIAEALLVPLSKDSLGLSSSIGWPLTTNRMAELGDGWKQRRQLNGAVIPPQAKSPRTRWSVLVHALRSDLEAPGRTNGFEIEYESRGIKYRSELGTHHVLAPVSDCAKFESPTG